MPDSLLLTNVQMWQAVTNNDTTYDGAFVYAVTTTGIYCRPSCKSRDPKPENVAYFPTPDAAQDAGFRACKRCTPNTRGPDDTLRHVHPDGKVGGYRWGVARKRSLLQSETTKA